jgi:hypothetical protein
MGAGPHLVSSVDPLADAREGKSALTARADARRGPVGMPRRAPSRRRRPALPIVVAHSRATLIGIGQRRARGRRIRSRAGTPRGASAAAVVAVRSIRRRAATAEQQSRNHEQRREREQRHERDRAAEQAHERKQHDPNQHSRTRRDTRSAVTHRLSLTLARGLQSRWISFVAVPRAGPAGDCWRRSSTGHSRDRRRGCRRESET